MYVDRQTCMIVSMMRGFNEIDDNDDDDYDNDDDDKKECLLLLLLCK